MSSGTRVISRSRLEAFVSRVLVRRNPSSGPVLERLVGLGIAPKRARDLGVRVTAHEARRSLPKLRAD